LLVCADGVVGGITEQIITSSATVQLAGAADLLSLLSA
jgi:hypothetical protein